MVVIKRYLQKLIEKVSIVLSIISFLIVGIAAVYFNDPFTYIILLLFFFTNNPLKTIYRYNQKIIHNSFFHIINIIISLFLIITFVFKIALGLVNYNIYYYPDDYLIYIVPCFLLLSVIGLFFKKEIRKRPYDITNYLLFINLIFIGISFFSIDFTLYYAAWLISIILIFIIIRDYNNLITRWDLQKYVFSTLLLCLINKNIVSALLLLIIYLDINHFSKNV